MRTLLVLDVLKHDHAETNDSGLRSPVSASLKAEEHSVAYGDGES